MDNLDDSENAKVSDSAYSNSCSNSQSRRSHSSKSTHSGSQSSGSSGYGGKPSGNSNNLGPPKKEKELKKKIQSLTETTTEMETEVRISEQTPVVTNEEKHDVIPSATTALVQNEKGVEYMDISSSDLNSLKDEVVTCNIPLVCTSENLVSNSTSNTPNNADGFSCVISMHDGVVMYTTSSLTTTLGFPKDMWIGRSFIDFVHPRDRSTLASQITSGLAIPKSVNGMQEKAQSPANSNSTMVGRIRRYRSLRSGFGVKDRVLTFMPFLLKLTFKNISDEEGKVTYLIIQAKPFFSAFKTMNEVIVKPVPFVMRHSANGKIEYVDPESVPYLGFLPQDLVDTDALQLYHPDDLYYLTIVYDTIIKEGGLPRSKPYRMQTKNGDYVKLETEWSSFINPWTKKLEFVAGKHHIIEGPTNPDVFQAPDPDKTVRVSDEETKKTQMLSENIIRIMNEALIKPAELAKQQMSKRCQDLATFMESLLEETPKNEDELRLEIQDADNSYYERDSVMLGGISPHHDFNDSKSSTGTPLSYNQLNYNVTLQSYFDSHQSIAYEDYNNFAGENVLGLKDAGNLTHGLSPMAQNSKDSDSNTKSGSGSPNNLGNYHPIRLTEVLLNKHNTEMEKELMKLYREIRSSSKGDREKNSNETRQKKKEHLARCNASFHTTSAVAAAASPEIQAHGVKRTLKHTEPENGDAHKQHCPAQRQSRRRQRTTSTNAAVAQPSAPAHTPAPSLSTITTTVSNNCPPQPTPSTSNMNNTYILGVGIPPQQISIMNHMPAMVVMPGMVPMYYTPATMSQIPTTVANQNQPTSYQFQGPAMMMYGQPMYGSPFVCAPMNPQPSMEQNQTTRQQSLQFTNAMNPLGLTGNNYNQSTKAVVNTSMYRDRRTNNLQQTQSDNTPDKTDEGSSYSSFYSSFFKTETGSAEESGDAKNANDNRSTSPVVGSVYYESRPGKQVAKRKVEPPWMEQVCVTSELIYKYQILSKNMEEVLTADKLKIKTLEQPSLVNEQLGQLYLDLQLEGVAARLSLEEGITSSSSSGEEITTSVTKSSRRKREYSKLVMIYEEDAPLPPPPENESAAETSQNPTF